MPSVVTRWQGLGAQNPVLARLMNDATVCGALVPSSSKVRSPHVVFTVATKVLPAAVALAGTSFCCFGAVWFAGGAVQPAASFGPEAGPPVGVPVAVLAGVVEAAAGVAASELPTSLGTTMTAATMRMTARITPKTCLSRVESPTGGLALFCCSSWRRRARARSCSLVTNLSSYGPHGRSPGVRSFYGTTAVRTQRDGSRVRDISPPTRGFAPGSPPDGIPNVSPIPQGVCRLPGKATSLGSQRAHHCLPRPGV